MTDKSKKSDAASKQTRPNILLILSDEYRFPRYFGTPEYGMNEAMKHILGFQGDDADIEGYAKYFPGLVSLRKNAVVLRNHTIAASACTPSRATMFTGQYGTRTGVTQTDGLFKSGDDAGFPWLQPDTIPTVGNWLRADGYETHYFGKCHFANPPDHSLEKFGFSDWEFSYPEPHGSQPNNMGLYRDYGFTDLVTTFLRGKGLALEYNREDAEGKSDLTPEPWFAVASYTNPHDITTYPMLPSQIDPGAQTSPTDGERAPLPIPAKGAKSVPPVNGSWELDLNPDGFPQENSNQPNNWKEDLYTNNKPDCQYEYSLKLGMALSSKPGNLEVAKHAPSILGLPFQLTKQPKEWVVNYMQYYAYLHYALDNHINAVMKTLRETGLDKNTIVIFTTDHGEYGGAHGSMLEKWHTAYQEAVHVPVVVNFPTGGGVAKQDVGANMIQLDQVTSHIDLVPTLLGLAGIDAKRRTDLSSALKKDGFDVPPLVGADLSGILEGTETGPVKDPDGSDRQGVLFITDDMITEPLTGVNPPESYDIYKQAVDSFIKTTDPHWKPLTENLYPGPVVQPNNLRCVRQKHWKLTRYFDPQGEKGDQWELYNLENDPNEMDNLLIYNAKIFPTANVPVGQRLSKAEIEAKAIELKKVLDTLTEKMLSTD